METGNNAFIILLIVSITITGFAIFFAIKKIRKVNKIPENNRRKELEKVNGRMSLSFFLKDVFDFFGYFTK